MPGFLTEMEQFWSSSDPEAEAWATFLALWFEGHGTKPVQAKEVVQLAQEVDGIYLGTRPQDIGRATTVLGRAIRSRKDRIIMGYCLRRDDGGTGGSARWICDRVSDKALRPNPSEDVGM